MNEMDFENQLQSIAKGLDYPRTPDIARSVMPRLGQPARPRFLTRSLAWSLTIVIVLLSSLLLIPPARAAIIEFIQVGIVRIFPRAVESTVEVPTTATVEVNPARTATSAPSDLLPVLNQLAGEVTLTDAQTLAGYPILLPSYPPDLGLPDRVFLQEADGAMTILVWTDPQNPGHPTLSLHFIPNESWVINKFGPVVIEETEVDGQHAVWAEGPYPLFLSNGNLEVTRLIEGHVLIWSDGTMTYRLETNLPLQEARKIAESLQPVP